MKISVCLTTYNSTKYIKETLDSIAQQTYKNYEIIVCNDSQKDNKELLNILHKYKSIDIKFFQNDKNLGYPLNLKKCVSKAKGDLLFLMGQDDIILSNTHFSDVIDIFKKHSNVGVITRPYYWFDTALNTPIRTTPKTTKEIIDLKKDGFDHFVNIIETIGQLSGLVYKKDLITHEFDTNVFTAHVYPFLSVLKKHTCYFFKDYTIAIRTSSSQTRFLSSIYNPSPLLTWVEMFNTVFKESEFEDIRKASVNYFSQNYLDLIQIKNYGYFKDLLFDIYYFIKFRPLNLLSITFWIYVLTVLIIPKIVLRWLVDFYKNNISRYFLRNVLNDNK